MGKTRVKGRTIQTESNLPKLLEAVWQSVKDATLPTRSPLILHYHLIYIQ